MFTFVKYSVFTRVIKAQESIIVDSWVISGWRLSQSEKPSQVTFGFARNTQWKTVEADSTWWKKKTGKWDIFPLAWTIKCVDADESANKGKLDRYSKLKVEFKPGIGGIGSKKMKKRRELDALVSNGKMGRNKKTTKKGQHELLRNDSESSEMEEFSIPQKTVVRKWGLHTRYL